MGSNEEMKVSFVLDKSQQVYNQSKNEIYFFSRYGIIFHKNYRIVFL